MNELEMKILVVGQLLGLMKYVNAEDERLQDNGVAVEFLGDLDERILNCIKFVAGMPKLKVEDIGNSDHWYRLAGQYKCEELTHEEVISQFVNWKSVQD